MENTENQKSLVSITAENKKGILARFTKFFSDNGMNIESLTLSAADSENKIHRTTAYITGDRSRVGELCQELEAMEDVYKVINLVADEYLERELCLVKIKTSNPHLSSIMSAISQARGATIFTGRNIMIFQIEAREEKIAEFIKQVSEYGEIETLRSGIIATGLNENIVSYN